MNNYYVYIYQFANGVAYIGKGKGRRYKETTSGRSRYFKNLINKHEYILCIVAEDVSENTAYEVEKILIKLFKKKNIPLANFTEGGRSGYRISHNKTTNVNSTQRKVYCYQTGITYDSVTKAAAATGVCASAVSIVCNKKGLQSKGFNFDYLENVSDFSVRDKAKNTRKATPITCVETGQTFKSVYALCQALNLHDAHIYRHLKGELSHVKGYTFTR